ncbi:MAG: ABC transporter substrate-binding protein [Jatrophihabitans sp.]
MRIVSLLPSATEIVYALGLQDQLHGVTDECDWPPEATGKRVVVRARQPAGLDQAEIDAWVREQAPAGGLYALDDAALAEIAPELVLTQDLCRVCAVPTGDVDAALDRVGCPSTVVTLEPESLVDVLDTIGAVARAAGVADIGVKVEASLRGRLAKVVAAVGRFQPRPVLVLEWLDPPFTAGHWVPDVVSAAGGLPILADPHRRSGATTWDEVRTALAGHPGALVVLAPCGTDPNDTWRQLREHPGLVPDGVLGTDSVAAELARPAPRLVDAVEALAAVLHPAAELPRRDEVMVPRPRA